jgi:hypothetical protein
MLLTNNKRVCLSNKLTDTCLSIEELFPFTTPEEPGVPIKLKTGTFPSD